MKDLKDVMAFATLTSVYKHVVISVL